jgi:hypothetical protein
VETARSSQQKALQINLDHRKFGTFAEIGAGQEVARWFFHAGKASATVAESISAYDMAISDGLYGKADHYVSRSRLNAMLDREYQQLLERVGPAKGANTAFFVYADTIATNTSSRRHAGHGWLGVRFQDRPGAEPSEAILHIELLDTQTVGQQEAVGLIGVNLLYGVFYLAHDPTVLIGTLMDGLNRRRVEVDMIKFSGPAFGAVDNRLISLQVLEQELTDVAMFTAAGDVVQPSEVLAAQPVLLERGSFRPVTNVTFSMLDRALGQLHKDTGEPVTVMEMTLKNLTSGDHIDHADFLARVDLLGALDKMVMISNFTRFDLVTTYLRQYTQNRIGLVAGVPAVRAIFDEQYYTELEGGILEGLGRLFAGPVRLFVYPTVDAQDGNLITAEQIDVEPRLKHLYSYVFENGFIEPIRQFDAAQLHVSPAEVLAQIQLGKSGWEALVPEKAAAVIKEERLFGYKPTT